MKILKEGKLFLEEVYTGTCENCGCEFECTLAEMGPSGLSCEGCADYKVACPHEGCKFPVYFWARHSR